MRMSSRHPRPEASLSLLALLLLMIGVVVYAFDRGGGVYFLPDWAAGYTGPGIFGPFADQLPTFVHPFVFILITAAILWPWPALLPAICAAWFAFECLFEVGQLAPLDNAIAAALPAWFDHVPVLKTTADYFIRGTYDPLDLLSIGFGTVAAYSVIRIIQRGDQQ